MAESIYPAAHPGFGRARHALAPETDAAFLAFSRQVFADGALTARVKQIIAVAVAHVTQRAGGSYAHSQLALGEIEAFSAAHSPPDQEK